MVKVNEVKMSWFEQLYWLFRFRLSRLWAECTGAVTVATITNGVNFKKFSVIATAQADAAAVLAHGLGGRPGFVAADLVIILIPVLTLVTALSGWTVGVVDATNVNLVKSTASAGSADAAIQL